MSVNMSVKVLDGVHAPKKSTDGSAGYDLAAYEDTYVYNTRTVKVKTGIFVSIPEGHVGLLVERSSLHTHGMSLANNLGVIDSDYRGEVLIPISSDADRMVRKGERLAQLIVVTLPNINIVVTGTLNETNRGSGGFGSTGL